MNFSKQAAEHILRHRCQVAIVSVRHIKFERCELRVVRTIDPLVAEYFSDLVDSVIASYDQFLQKELGRNSQLQILVELL